MLRRSFALGSVLLAGLSVGLVGGPFLRAQLADHKPQQTGIAKELGSFHPVVNVVLPAVVSIETRDKPATKVAKKPAQPRERRPFNNQQLPEEFRRFFGNGGGLDDLPFEMPDQSPRHAFGSGFLVDPHGIILTNNHVVDGAEQVEVQLADGRKFLTKDIHTDPRTDLAIVRIQTKEALPYLQLGDSKAMQIGDRVLAVGAPFGLTGTVTTGIISAKGRSMHMNMFEDFLQTDAAINPGNSGGPLVNLEGQVIGINTAIKSESGGSQGVGFAISSDMAKKVMDQLEKNGRVTRGYLGVEIKNLSEEVAARLGLGHEPGLLVAKVHEDSPAAKAGLKDGDVITSLDGKKVPNVQDLQHMVGEFPIGKAVPVTVQRDGKSLTLQVKIEDMPGEFGSVKTSAKGATHPEEQETRMDKLGMTVTDMTPEMAKQFGYKGKTAGAMVTEVESGSSAADAGLRRGMLVVKVDQKDVPDAAAVREAVDKGDLKKGVLLQVRTPQGATDYVMLKNTEATPQN
jgi:serine protease Do